MWQYTNSDELYHYGVPGMKWGKRKAKYETSDTRKRFDSAKANYKSAKKSFNKSYNKAYNYSSNGYAMLFSKKRRNEADKRWEDTLDKANKLNTAKKAYKTAKKNRKDSINKKFQKLQSDASFRDRMLYNDATRKKAAKYMVDNNMSMSEARKKANRVAWRNTSLMVAGLAAYSAATLYKNR